MKPKKVRRGAVLIVVMGVLFVLALLATTFASLQGIERKVARNYLDGVRAKQLARAGIEFAYSRLMDGLNSGQLGSSNFIKSLNYYGGDIAETGNPTLVNTPLELARNPSLAVEVTGGNPLGAIESPQDPTNTDITPRNIFLKHPMSQTPVQVGFSGLMESGVYGQHSDMFVLNVRDASGMIYVNDGVGESQTYGAVTKNLRRLLNRLGQCSTINLPTLGDMLINARPPTGYKSKRELQNILGSINYQKVQPFITTHAWVDRNVPNPVPLSGNPAVLNYYMSWMPGGTMPAGGLSNQTIYFRGLTPRYRYGHRKNFNNILQPGSPNVQTFVGASTTALPAPNGLQHAIYGMDELNPRYIEMTSRAPVNLNSARREVLMALLADLHGFWVQERRRDTPPSSMGATVWNDVAHTYDAGGTDEGDQFGFVVLSDPIKPPNAPPGPNTAAWIADEIIACRNRQMSPNGLCNYATAPFGGPFRTWRQFYMFCDNLVDIGAVQDTRVTGGNSLYYWHVAPAQNKWGSGLTNVGTPSINIYRRIAAQAIADAIKANFNPNLHLNETNPDENMNLLIDKTDLVVNSTEGCFVPAGYYEIESLGRLVRPHPEGPPEALSATNSTNAAELMAEFKIEAAVKLYDGIRFTTQRDFYGYGPSSPAGPSNPPAPNYWQYTQATLASLPATNNMLSIEIGPEPDWGVGPERNGWGGYIAWPTNYGDLSAAKAPGAVANPDPGFSGCTLGIGGCIMHGHYTRSDFLTHHWTNDRRNLCRHSAASEQCENWPDQQYAVIENSGVPLGVAGPYDPLMGSDPISYAPDPALPAWPTFPQNRYRLSRHFRVPAANATGTWTPTFLQAGIAPMDLRIDGVYLERHSVLGYWMNNPFPGGGHQQYNLLFAYWIKPKYYPEMSGKTRAYWNWSRIDVRGDYFNLWSPNVAHNPFPMTHYFASSQNPMQEGWASAQWPGFQANWTPTRPASMIFLSWASWLNYPGSYCPSQCYLGASWGAASPTLNHHYHYGNLAPATGYAGCSHPMASRRMGASNSPAGAYAPSNQYVLRSPLASGRWMHFMFYWLSTSGGWGINTAKQMYINGESGQHAIAYASNYADNEWQWPHPCQDWSYHVNSSQVVLPGYYTSPSSQHTCCNNMYTSIYDQNARNIVRIGEADKYSSVQANPVGGSPTSANPATRNFVPDATIDEYFLVNNNALSAYPNLLAIYNKGRYHIPRLSNEGLYESPNFNLITGGGAIRMLPPPAVVPVPSGVTAVLPPPLPSGVSTTQTRIIGMSWTWFGEWVDVNSPNLDPVLTDYATQTSPVPMWIKPRLEGSVYIDSTWYGPYTNEFFSPVIVPSTGAAVPVVSPQNLRYRMKFAWGTGTGSVPALTARVLATPYIDDVTIYFDPGDSGFVDYHMS